MIGQPFPPAGVGPARHGSLRNALAIAGTLLAAALVVGAAAGAWFAVERYLVDPGSVAATSAGLPTERIDDALPWRSFRHAAEHADGSVEAAIDLDTGEMRFVVMRADSTVVFERGADAAYVETPAGWEVVDDAEAVSRTANLAPAIGPFLLTDAVPPAAVAHTTVVSDVEVDGVRVLELDIDKAAFEAADPLAFRRWLAGTGEAAAEPGARTLHVRSDGHVVALDREGMSARWSDLAGPVSLESPLAAVRAGAPGAPAVPEPEPAP